MNNLAKKAQSGSSFRLWWSASPSALVMLATLSVAAASDNTKAGATRFPAIASPLASANRVNSLPPDKRAAIEQMLKHIYAVYLGIRSCAEISVMHNDKSFSSEVSLDESRQVLRQVDAAANEIGINSAQIWDAEAPIALITAEALKTRPETHLIFCQRMGSIFRVDAGNLQAGFAQAGAKTSIIVKDY